mgnify:CR=1 FL=1
MSVAEVLNPRALIPCGNVGAEVLDNQLSQIALERAKEIDTQSVRGRDRE